MQVTDKRSLSISNSKETILFLGKLLVFGLFFLLYLNHIIPQYDGSYDAALIEKVERLTSIEGPKIVLLGNSNLSFGIQSELIEEEFGMPVVNMGLDLELGNAFHEEMARYNVCEGDIYILCHTNFAESGMDPQVAWMAIENHFQLWKILRMEDVRPMMDAFPGYLKSCLALYVTGEGHLDSGGVYSRSGMNEYGDERVFREKSLFDIFFEPVEAPAIDKENIDRINSLNAWLKERGATLLVAGYPIGNGDWTADEADFVSFQEELEKQLDCEVISDYTDYLYDYKYFYNAVYHMTTEGAQIRTQQLIEDLKNWQAGL